ncbi:MAG TPA: hypothetical protein VN041_18300 [Microbacterium sp.]|nr:hypothetical protein [Microbacterium sp.]
MRILTVRNPWAEAIIYAGKDVENRARNVAGDYRGPVAIYCAKRVNTLDEWDAFRRVHPAAQRRLAQVVREGLPLSFGKIIGVVDLVDVHPVANPHFHPICHDLTGPNDLAAAAARGDGACSPWAHPEGRWHLVLANPRPLAEPIPYRGALGLRNLAVNDPITTARILAQIGETA